MTHATIATFENSIHTSNEWLSELGERFGRDDPQQAYRILRAVLMTLRDRITVEEATDLGAQLPLLIRGIYYEGWNPSKTPTGERSQEEFLAHVASLLQEGTDGDPENATRAVFALLSGRITGGEIQHVKSNLPKDVQALWG